MRIDDETPGWSDELTRLHESEAGSNLIIDVYSRDCGLAALQRRIPANASILELGSSSGFMLKDLRAAFPHASITGSDYLESIVRRLRGNSSELVEQIDITKNVLPDKYFDAVVALNVFEHIEDDARAASEVARILKQGGVFYIEVPSGPHLYDGYDASLLHFRRYTRRSLRKLLIDAELSLLEESAIGFLPYPGFYATKKINRFRYGKAPNYELVRRSIQRTSESVLVSSAIKVERIIRSYVSLPFGIRQTALAVKQSM